MKKDIGTDLFFNHLISTKTLSEKEIELVLDHSNHVTYKKKDIIFKQNTFTSHVMFIKSGLVKIFKEGRNNKSIILKIATPGNFLGLISIFGESTFQYSATAIEECEITFIDINVYYDLIENNGKYASSILKILSTDNLYIFDKLLSQYQKQLPGKIADLILYFSEQIYQSAHFEFPLTRNELAEFAGTTKESMIRTLTEFKNDKIIDLDGKSVKINSIDIVKTLSKIG
jgi:CRP-like cAMP-binding protein